MPHPIVIRDRQVLERRARFLEYGTATWNSIEAVVTITAGLAADSVGLVAFGLDSCVEVFGCLVVIWQLRRSHDGDRTRKAVRLIGGAFLLLAVYLSVAVIQALRGGHQPSRSWIGLSFLAVTVAMMVFLGWGKLATGRRLANEPLTANARMTLLDAGLASATVVAVFVSVRNGWWWFDPAAGALVAVAAVREGLSSIRSSRLHA